MMLWTGLHCREVPQQLGNQATSCTRTIRLLVLAPVPGAAAACSYCCLYCCHRYCSCHRYRCWCLTQNEDDGHNSKQGVQKRVLRSRDGMMGAGQRGPSWDSPAATGRVGADSVDSKLEASLAAARDGDNLSQSMPDPTAIALRIYTSFVRIRSAIEPVICCPTNVP